VLEATKGGTNHRTTVPIYAEHTRLLNACVSVFCLPRSAFSDKTHKRILYIQVPQLSLFIYSSFW